MVEVLAIDCTFDPRFRSETELLDLRDILTICSTLVIVTAVAETETQELRLARFSIKEYSFSDKLKPRRRIAFIQHPHLPTFPN